MLLSPVLGTRFRPLSFEVPKPLFPVAGVPMIQHHIEACAQVTPEAPPPTSLPAHLLQAYFPLSSHVLFAPGITPGTTIYK